MRDIRNYCEFYHERRLCQRSLSKLPNRELSQKKHKHSWSGMKSFSMEIFIIFPNFQTTQRSCNENFKCEFGCRN